jgi:hypothetical protein
VRGGDESFENPFVVLEVFGVPLHAQEEVLGGVFNPFNSVVVRVCIYG